MGPLGVEGPFRRCCEMTMKLLEEKMSTLLAVLRPLIYDPSAQWRRESSQLSSGHVIREKINTFAVQHNENVEKRLKRYVSDRIF